jgi:putative aldouronate transport system substrate-binding protein
MIKALGSRDILEPVGTADLDISLLLLTQEEQDDYNDLQNDIHTKVAEMTAAFITGQADLDADWDTYVADLEDMGIQTIIDNYQAALERYNAG